MLGCVISRHSLHFSAFIFNKKGTDFGANKLMSFPMPFISVPSAVKTSVYSRKPAAGKRLQISEAPTHRQSYNSKVTMA